MKVDFGHLSKTGQANTVPVSQGALYTAVSLVQNFSC